MTNLEMAAMLQMTKGQRKKAKKQQKAAMQLTQSSPDLSSPTHSASSAPAPASGAHLQVCPPTNSALCLALLLTTVQHVCRAIHYQPRLLGQLDGPQHVNLSCWMRSLLLTTLQLLLLHLSAAGLSYA